MGIHGQRRFLVQYRSKDIGRFSADARNGHQLVHLFRECPMEAVHHGFRHTYKVFRFVVGIGTALYQFKNLLRRCSCQMAGSRILLVKTRRDHVHPFIGTLGREDDGNRQLIPVVVLQLCSGIGGMLLKITKDMMETFFFSHRETLCKFAKKDGCTTTVHPDAAAEMKSDSDFDVVIVGAGPAGATLALHLAGKGIKTAILDKDRFPRPKICGDALGGKVINVLRRIPGSIFEDFLNNVEKHPSTGIRFYSPRRQMVTVPFPVNEISSAAAPGYVCRRDIFDSFMAGHLRNAKDTEFFEGVLAEKVVREPGRMIVHTTAGPLSAQLVAGADGFSSVVRKNLTATAMDTKHTCIGLRGYYTGISYPEGDDCIELHFLRSLLPGYLWIFPGPGGVSNVGIGMLKSKVIRERVNMISLFKELIVSDPLLRTRFEKAIPLGKPEAQGLPMGTMPLKRYGDRFLLLGDAGFMVDPFSGEGIGNAMGSAETAAPVILGCFDKLDYSENALSLFGQNIDRRFGGEFRLTGKLQRLVGFPWLINQVIKMGSKKPEMRESLSQMFINEASRAAMARPGFYLRWMMK